MLTVNFDWLPLAPGQRCLDVGCGEGRHTLSAYLKPEVEVVGVDLGMADLRTAHARIDDMANYAPEGSVLFAQADGLCLPFADASFDRVICSEVLEHIPNYLSLLEEIDRVLKPGGQLCISVPRAWPEWICWQLSRDYAKTPGGHIRIFNRKHLQREIERQGYQCYHHHGAHGLHAPYWWLRCLFWSRGDDQWLVRKYHQMLVWDLLKRPPLTRWMERLLDPWMGKSVVMYFGKPLASAAVIEVAENVPTSAMTTDAMTTDALTTDAMTTDP